MSAVIIPIGAKTIGASTYRGRKAQTLLQAARHNLRDIQNELGANSHIDATRICLNEIVAGPGTPAGVAALALALMAGAGVEVGKLRKDHTQAHELLFTLPADTTINTQDYFTRCHAWTVDQFGEDNILSAVIHRDESAPHMHVLLAPIDGGRYVGTSLIDRGKLAKLRAGFATDVAPAFGLRVMPPLTGAARAKVIALIHERLESTHDPVLQSVLWLTVKADIARNPASYMTHFGIVPEYGLPGNDGGKAFKRIALSSGKGGKTERRAKPYGFERAQSKDVAKPYGFENDPEKHRNPSCVGFTPKVAPAPAPKAPPLSAQAPPPDQHFDDVDQPLSDIPNADGEIAAPAPAPTPRPAPALPIERGETLAAPPPLTRAFRPAPLPASTTSTRAQPEAPFVELTTRHRDCDQSPDHYDFTSGDFIPTKPPAPRLLRQAADGWVTAALDTRSQTPGARRH